MRLYPRAGKLLPWEECMAGASNPARRSPRPENAEDHAMITMFRTAIALTLAMALTFAMSATHAAEDISRVNGAVELAAGQQARNLSTVNGGIQIGDDARFNDADTVNGGIRAGNRIQGSDLTTVNGAIELGEQAVVESLTTVNGRINAGPGLRASDDVETVSGSIFIDRDGRVDGDVSTVSSGIGLVATEVMGNVETVSGDITVGIGSRVHGDLRVRKPSTSWLRIGKDRSPRIVIGPDAVVDGELVFEREVSLYVHDTARTGRITGATPTPFSTPRAPRD
ncbi:hypothetical protein [Luteimonas sp. A277]